ncbi:hypothetical protein [Brucella intermedia]|uniref:hypothetical protein n=1 Tax=Brucella intermedia TaxID=94625 RepID=UPI00235DFC3C|nr:hypothetical protein [Brucella intermedia]
MKQKWIICKTIRFNQSGKRSKTARRGAEMLSRAGELTLMWTPDEEQEAMRASDPNQQTAQAAVK